MAKGRKPAGSLESDLVISTKSANILRMLGYHTAQDLRDVHVPTLLDSLGWGVVHKIIKALVTLGLKPTFEVPDATWDEDRWHALVQNLVAQGIVNWEEVAIAILGAMNPPQVGTSLASNKNFQKQYARGKTMQVVMAWFYGQNGKCAKCGRRLHIEVDHIKGKNEFIREGRPAAEAETIGNLQLLCKRCNVVKRESHLLGGLSFHTAEAALMWILLVKQPADYETFKKLCRRAGLTMADVRFQEGWAMAEWLRKAGLYPLRV